MFHSKQGRMFVGLLVFILAVAAVTVIIVAINPAAAQAPPQGPPPGNQMGGMQPMMQGGMGGMGGGMQPMMPGGMCVMNAIAVSGEYVYVVRGNTLYQFSAKTLKPVNKTPIEEMKAPGSGPDQTAPKPPQ